MKYDKIKKIVLCICVTVTVISATVIGFATGTIQDVAKHLTGHSGNELYRELRQEVQAEDDQRKAKIDARLRETAQSNKFEQMLAALDATQENPIDYNNVVYNYEYLRLAYHFNQEELDFIADMIIKGYEPMDIMDICYFWMDTNEDISIIEKIYLLKGVYEGSTWIENAFNKVTNDKCGVLTEEDVDEYIGKGLSVQDISLANTLCRRGKLTIQEILEKRLEGVSFAELSAEVYEEKTEELPQEIRQQTSDRKAKISNRKRQRDVTPEVPEADLIDHRTVSVSRQMAKIHQSNPKEYYQRALNGESVDELLKQTEDVLRDKVNASLAEKSAKKQFTNADWDAYIARERQYE